jgi:TPR repeat protein
MYELGKGCMMYYRGALDMYQQSAKQGNPLAQLSLGMLLTCFSPCALSLSKNIFLGHMYDAGKGCCVDHCKAFSSYLQSAEQGNANAQYNVGT